MGARPRLAPPVVPISVRGPVVLRALRVLQAAASAPNVLGEDDAVAYAVALLRRRIR